MPNQIYALGLIFLAALPNFGFKANLENQLTQVMIGKPAVVASQNHKSTDPIIPLKTDPLSQATNYSKAAYFIDMKSGEVLYAKNENAKLPMASTTKLMTAIVAIEHLNLNQTVTVKPLNTLPLDSVMGLAPGYKIKVSELLNGLLIESGADAAETLAVATSGTENKFVALMNEKAKLFGLTNTQFTNSVGHDDSGNYSTAKELSALARIALSNKTIADIVRKQTYVATTESGKTFYLSNTNLLLSDPNYKGVKTGTTTDAGQCLITLYDDGTRQILGVVLDSPDRFGETSSVVDWTKQAFKW
jgi:serine-type D-Ala-D-Ala carboxypeptidase (penicillin-binding protein 5/6)